MQARDKSVWGHDFENLPPTQDEDGKYTFHVPWLTFIQKWAKLPQEQNAFGVHDDALRMLIISSYFPVVAGNGEAYPAQELYFTKEHPDSDWTRALQVAVLLDNEGGRARIEFFNEKWIAQAEAFLNES